MTLSEFAKQVELMRVSQKHHEAMLKKAKRSTERYDFAVAANAKDLKKVREQVVDEALPKMLLNHN